jgi:hypothetical protein
MHHSYCDFTRVVISSIYLYFGIFVIFFDIASFQRRGFLQIISSLTDANAFYKQKPFFLKILFL